MITTLGMTKAQMARLGELLDQALPMTPTGRRRWMDSLPDEDRPLLQTLREGLMTDDPEAAIALRLDRPAHATLTGANDEPAVPARQPGERFGPYELLRLLGVGGMAEVWLARRTDGLFDRQVALKIPRLGQVAQEMMERFARERRILAALECPGIARLYDAGVDEQGLPYFAMEYVQGESLQAWCDARQLDTDARVRVFLQVLDAVGHAHAHQVIHGDLKPSNILVTSQGEVRLLDFGVARLLQQEASASPLTRTYGRPLTPEYASPELLRGEAIDLRSDIYSLGVVLHELLVGLRPGQRGATTSGRGALPPELRGIVQQAIAVLPDDRYADVASFAAALLAHASGGAGRRMAHPLLRARLAVALAIALAVGVTGTLIWRNRVPVEQKVLPVATQMPQAAAPTIAVLPFVDLSEQQDQGYLSDGLAEELLNLLAKIPDLAVTARGSSFAFRDRKLDVPAIARQLHVEHILDGSVRKSGSRLRFSVQLVQARTGRTIWSETYDRELRDIFEVQEDVANAVVDALKVRLLARQSIPPSLRTQNTRAYEEYLVGRQFQEGFTLERQQRALAAFRRAAELDPSFAAAHAAIAAITTHIGSMTMDRKLYGVAAAEAERALALEPKLVEAYVARAKARIEGDWDFAGGLADLQTAQDIDPNNMAQLQSRASYLAMTGKPEEALALRRLGVERSPLASNAWESLASVLMLTRRYDEARQALDRADQLSPYSDYRHYVRTRLELYAGNYAEALRLARANPDPGQRDATVALAAFSAGEVDAARAALQRLVDRVPDLYAIQIATAHAWMGERDEAFRWLDRAVELHDPGLMAIHDMRELDSLRDDPRFQRVLRRMNLAD